MPTYAYNILPSDTPEYKHYTPSDKFDFHLEFDYPGYWGVTEHIDEISSLSLDL